ncbi:MAG: hypothetical protein ACE5GA_04125 [Candidatus Zixiibacteriota bacterium]
MANFKCDSTIPPDRFAPALQRLLPTDIFIRASELAPDGFHARFDATLRTYRYRIGSERSALERTRRWELSGEASPNLARLNEAAALFSGKMDCSALCVPRSLPENRECEISVSKWAEAAGEYRYEISANRFLHSMVRAIVGLSVRYAQTGAPYSAAACRGFNPPELTLDGLKNILKAGKWTTDHLIAPPQGLYLVEVTY